MKPNQTKINLLYLCLLLLATIKLSAQTDNEFLGTTTEIDDGTGMGTTTTLTTGGSNTIGDYNVFLGDGAGASNTSGNQGVFIGTAAGAMSTTASENVYIGYQAGFSSTNDGDNVFVGFRAGYHNDDYDGTFIGNAAGFNNTTGADNTFIGETAGASVTTGDDNTFVGNKAGAGTLTITANTTATTNPNTASDNTAVGSLSGYQLRTGYRNAFFGNEAGFDNEEGYRNTFIGDSTGIDNNVGRLNTFVGQAAGSANESASYNTFVGASAGGDANRTNKTDGSSNRNTYVGVFAGFGAREGTDNVGIGAFADISDYSASSLANAKGRFTGNSTSTKREFNTYIGSQAYANANEIVLLGFNARVDGNKSIAIGANSRVGQTNAMALGYSVYVNQANTLALGGDTATNRYSVGIGTVAANRNASLDLADVDKGFLINRVTTAERTTMTTTPASGAALTTTDEGLMVYDTDLNALYVWDGTAWKTHTDAQALALSTNTLSITGNASTVDLSGYLDNTDAQSIGLSTNTLSITGNTSTVDLSGYLDNTDAQSLTLDGSNNLSISGGNSIDLSGLADGTGTDNQNLTSATVNASNVLTVAIEGGTSVNVDLSPILSDLESQNNAQQNQIDDLITRITALEACACTTLSIDDNNANERKYGPILYQNIPNPFNGTTSIKYYVPLELKNAAIVFSNNIGQVIDNVPLKKLGDGELFFNSESLASGIYYYTLYISGRKIDTKKMVIE